VEIPLPRAKLEVAFEPLLERIRRLIERALSGAGRSAGEIDEVLLVGGATRMPCLGRLATQLFGRLPRSALPPDEAVALGAAMQAALAAGDSTVSDLISNGMAPIGLDSAPGHRVGAARMVDMTADPESEHPRCRQNPRIDASTLDGSPETSAGAESIRTGFGDELDDVLDIDATAIYTERSATFTLERAPGGRSADDLASARQRLAALQFHPREALPNVTALGRADSLYVELVGAAQMRLGACIADFRAALETRDNARILREREHLLVRLAELGRGPA
jgi:molecular chaperone HscC